MNLTCVKCTSVLNNTVIGGIEVDVCPSCGGLWLDRGEIERLQRVPAATVDELRTALGGGSQAGMTGSPWSCPRCPGKLTEAQLGRIKVEVCKSCHGIFLDKGELDGALAAVKGSTVEQVIALAGSVRA